MTRNDRGAGTRLAVSLIGHMLKREGFVRGRTFKWGLVYYKGDIAAIVIGGPHGVAVLGFDLIDGEAP